MPKVLCQFNVAEITFVLVTGGDAYSAVMRVIES